MTKAYALSGLGCGLVGMVCLLSACSPREQRWAGARRELVFERLTVAALGKAPGAGVLVVGNPFAAIPGASAALREADQAAAQGVQRGVAQAGGRYLGSAVPALRDDARRDPSSVPVPAGASTPISFLTERRAWDGIRAAHPEAGIWISLIGVPADLGETRAWLDADGPKWALYLPDLRLIGTLDGIRSAFESGRLAAMVLERPGAPPESEPMGADGVAEFERRYLLVTRESLEGVVAAWPQLFP